MAATYRSPGENADVTELRKLKTPVELELIKKAMAEVQDRQGTVSQQVQPRPQPVAQPQPQQIAQLAPRVQTSRAPQAVATQGAGPQLSNSRQQLINLLTSGAQPQINDISSALFAAMAGGFKPYQQSLQNSKKGKMDRAGALYSLLNKENQAGLKRQDQNLQNELTTAQLQKVKQAMAQEEAKFDPQALALKAVAPDNPDARAKIAMALIAKYKKEGRDFDSVPPQQITQDAMQIAAKMGISLNKPLAAKAPSIKTVIEGDEKVTYQYKADGTRTEIGRGPRYKPGEVNVTFPEEVDKFAAEAFSTARQAGIGGQRKLRQLNNLSRTLQGIPTGPVAGNALVQWLKGAAKELGTNFGFEFDVGSVTDINVAKQIINDLVVSERGRLKGQGQISNFEVKMLQNALDNLENDPAARKVIIDILGESAKADIDFWQASTLARKEQGGNFDFYTFEQEWLSKQPYNNPNYINPGVLAYAKHKGLAPGQTPQPTPQPTPTKTEAPEGTIIDLQDGRKMRKTNGQWVEVR